MTPRRKLPASSRRRSPNAAVCAKVSGWGVDKTYTATGASSTGWQSVMQPDGTLPKQTLARIRSRIASGYYLTEDAALKTAEKMLAQRPILFGKCDPSSAPSHKTKHLT
jgi:hypothetical protein